MQPYEPFPQYGSINESYKPGMRPLSVQASWRTRLDADESMGTDHAVRPDAVCSGRRPFHAPRQVVGGASGDKTMSLTGAI